MTTYGPLEPGARIGDLVIEAEIGAGGFGVVYRARDQVVGRLVALKVLAQGPASPTDSAARAKILREVRALGAVVHPNIATLYHVHEIPDLGAGFELEYVDGPSFEAFLARTPAPSLDDVLRITRGVVAGLRAAHAARVAHGDVKPTNVLIAPDGTPKIVDFGLARILRSDSGKTSSGHGSGTPHYLAPEVVEGGPHTPAGDVWSVGALLYRALAGRVPFEGESLAALYFRVLNLEPAPLSPEVPEAVRVLVAACLSKKPERRPPLDDRFLDVLTPKGATVGTAAVGRVSPPPVGLPLVGRTAELASLVERLDVAMAGRASLGVVAGATGVGKTRLLEALGEAATRRGAEVVRVAVHGHEGLARTVARALANAPSAPSLSRGGEVRAPRGASAEVEAALRAVTAARAVVLLVDDAHRATTDDVRFVSRLVARFEGERLLVVAAGRTDEPGVATDAGSPLDALVADADHGFRTDVAALPKDEILAILEARTRDRTTAPGLLEYVVARSAGNPLFAIHLLAEATAGGKASTSSAGGPRLDAGAPQALKDLFARRLRRLPSPEREVLDAAAVDGVEFDGEAVAVALRVDELDVLRRLERLVREHGLVEARPRGHRFTHPVLREVVYGEVSPDLRRLYHREIAKHLEGRRSAVEPERIGAHWEGAGEPARAAPSLVDAAARACKRLEFRRAVALADRAGPVSTLVGGRPDHPTVDRLFELATAFAEVGRKADRDAIYDALDREARVAEDRVLRLRVIARQGLGLVLSSELARLDEGALRDAASDLPDCAERGIACYALAILERRRTHLELAASRADEAERIFRAVGEEGRRGSALDQKASIAFRSGRAKEAARLYRDAAEVCRNVGRPANATISELNAVAVEFELGRVEGVAAALERSRSQLRIEGGSLGAALACTLLASARLAEGDLERARADVRTGIDELEAMSARTGLVEALALAADLELIGGRGDDARALLERAVPQVDASGDARSACLLTTVRASRELLYGSRETATEFVRRAVDAAASTDDYPLRGTVALQLAEVGAIVGAPEIDVAVASLCESAPGRDVLASVTSARALLDGARCLRLGDAAGAAATVEILARPNAGHRAAILRGIAASWARRAAVREVLRTHGHVPLDVPACEREPLDRRLARASTGSEGRRT